MRVFYLRDAKRRIRGAIGVEGKNYAITVVSDLDLNKASRKIARNLLQHRLNAAKKGVKSKIKPYNGRKGNKIISFLRQKGLNLIGNFEQEEAFKNTIKEVKKNTPMIV